MKKGWKRSINDLKKTCPRCWIDSCSIHLRTSISPDGKIEKYYCPNCRWSGVKTINRVWEGCCDETI